jgi:cytochrome c1
MSGKDKKRELMEKEYRKIDAKCRCGKDHKNDKPANPDEIAKSHAQAMADEIDRAALLMSDKGYQVGRLEDIPRRK